MGGAMLAAVGCGAYPDVETIGKKLAQGSRYGRTGRNWLQNMKKRYRKFRKLYPAMKELFR